MSLLTYLDPNAIKDASIEGTTSAYLTIDGVRGRAYETKVAKNSKGEIKQYCEADLIN